MHIKIADEMANSVDPDQTAPSESAPFVPITELFFIVRQQIRLLD